MITAETHSDDRAVEVNFDATPYFQKAPDEDLARLIECGFAGDQAADQVAIGLADSNPEIGAMFAYLEARNKASRKSIGFEVSVNEDEALTWLRQHRPGAFRTLNLGDYDLAKCDSCGLISDRDAMSKREKTGEMRCEECQTVCWWVTKNPDTGDIEIPQGIHPGGNLYPSTKHALGYIEGPEPGDDPTWDANWHEALLELNQDGTAVKPIATNKLGPPGPTLPSGPNLLPPPAAGPQAQMKPPAGGNRASRPERGQPPLPEGRPMQQAAGTHPILEQRIARRADAAKTARIVRANFRGHFPSAYVRRITRDAIAGHRPTAKPTPKNLRREILENLASITHAYTNPPTHLPCGEDDAWYERLHAHNQETLQLARALADMTGLRFGHDRFLTPEEHERVGLGTCPYCLSPMAFPLKDPDLYRPVPSLLHPSTEAQMECLDCDIVFSAPHQRRGEEATT